MPPFEERPVAFEWTDPEGDGSTLTLRGTLTVPTAAAARSRAPKDAAAAAAAATPAPTPAVVLAHGYLSTRDGIALFPRLARALAELQTPIASLRFDFRGAGETKGEARLADYASQARQIGAARRFLEEQEQERGAPGGGGRPFRVIGVLGHSKGATSALLYADEWARQQRSNRSPSPTPLRLVHLSGRFDLRRGLERFFGAGAIDRLLKGEIASLPVRSPEMVDLGKMSDYLVEFELTAEGARERFGVDVAAAAARVGASGRVGVLSVHGSADRAVPCEDGVALWRAVLEAEEEDRARPARARMVELEGADHNFTREEYIVAALDAIVPFFAEAAADSEG